MPKSRTVELARNRLAVAAGFAWNEVAFVVVILLSTARTGFQLNDAVPHAGRSDASSFEREGNAPIPAAAPQLVQPLSGEGDVFTSGRRGVATT